MKKLIKTWNWSEVRMCDLIMWDCLAATERPTLEIEVCGDEQEIRVYE